MSTIVSGLSAVVYVLNVTETESQCKSIDTIAIHEPDVLLVSDSATNDKCNSGNGSITLAITGGAIPYNYLWSTNNTGGGLLNLYAGTYSVTVTDNNGCVGTASIDITFFPELSQPSISGGPEFCENSGIIDAGPGYASYLWNDVNS